MQNFFQNLFRLDLPRTQASKWRWFCLLLLVSSLLPYATACKTLNLPNQAREVSLQMEVVPDSDQSRYTVSGTTNLPDDTPITIAAIRYFSADGQTPAQNRPTFTVLDYTSTIVNQGKWQAELTLQQRGTDGRDWEAWQMEQSRLGLALQPTETVSFVTSLMPIDQLVPLEQELAEDGFRLPRGMVRSTAEGQRYAEVSQTIALAAPNVGETAPTIPEPHNYGWGDRYKFLQEPPNETQYERPTERQTNAPATPSEFLR